MAPHYVNQGQSILERWVTPLALIVIVGIGSWNAWTTIDLLKNNIKVTDSISEIRRSIDTWPPLFDHVRNNDVTLHNHQVEICRLQNPRNGGEKCGVLYYQSESSMPTSGST